MQVLRVVCLLTQRLLNDAGYISVSAASKAGNRSGMNWKVEGRNRLWYKLRDMSGGTEENREELQSGKPVPKEHLTRVPSQYNFRG